MAVGQGTAVIDFGTGANEASVAVTGQAGILATGKVDAFVMADDATIDHDAVDHRYFNALCGLTCGTPTDGVGFTIYATALNPLEGTFQVRWVWVN